MVRLFMGLTVAAGRPFDAFYLHPRFLSELWIDVVCFRAKIKPIVMQRDPALSCKFVSARNAVERRRPTGVERKRTLIGMERR